MDEADYEYRRTNRATGETNTWIGKPGLRAQDRTTKEPFLMMYQAACREIATKWDLQGFDFRVFIFLLGILDTENWVDVHHARIARQMGSEEHRVDRTAVTRSINRLVHEGLIFKGPERTYRLNPGVGWKGDAVGQDKANREALAGKLSVVRP